MSEITKLSDREYPWVRLYYSTIGSFAYYINDMVAKAKAQNAPPDAVLPRQKDGVQIGTEWWTAREWIEQEIGTIGVGHSTLLSAAKRAGVPIPGKVS